MTRHEKFLFDTSFEHVEAEPLAAAAKESPPPRFSEEDLARAREEGFATGRKTGAEEARQALEQSMAQALGTIAQRLPELSRSQSEAIERQGRELIEAALTVIRKLFPRLARRHGLAEVESLVAECLERLREEPRIVIRVADSLLDAVQERVGPLAARSAYEGKIVLLSQEELLPGDVRVEWADGGAERDSRRLWEEIDGLVARAIGASADAGSAPGPDHSQAPTLDAAEPEPTEGVGRAATASA